MEDDLYDEAAEEPAGAGAESETRTGLLPKDFFMGKEKQPGDICSIRVVKIYDDQVEVEYIPHEGGEGEEEPMPEPAMEEVAVEEEMM